MDANKPIQYTIDGDLSRPSNISVSQGSKASKMDVGEEKKGMFGDLGNKVTGHNYNAIHEASDGKRYRIIGEVATIGEKGKDAISYTNFKNSTAQEVDKDGKPIGEKYAASVLIQDGKIVNLHGESGMNKQAMDMDKSITDHMNVQKGGGTELTMVTPDGLTTGYLAHDDVTGGPVLVAGDKRYGVGEHMVTQNEDGSLMYRDVTTDPKTGKVVAGKNSSILVSEMAMTNPHDNRTYHVKMLTDTNTGNQLAIDAESGTFWKRTQGEQKKDKDGKIVNDMHITEYRGYEQRGGVLSTIAERVIPGGGRVVGDVIQGVNEANPISSLFKKGGTEGKNTQNVPTTGRELDKQQKEWGEYFEKSKGWKPAK
ncbi:MAG: hypothetical protein HZB80_04080 [Deltaproteobacteria bacterium]|nr:hypothetical protein [Deltaproteobacteria bacterium]